MINCIRLTSAPGIAESGRPEEMITCGGLARSMWNRKNFDMLKPKLGGYSPVLHTPYSRTRKGEAWKLRSEEASPMCLPSAQTDRYVGSENKGEGMGMSKG